MPGVSALFFTRSAGISLSFPNADRQQRSIDGERRNNCVYAGSVKQACIHHGCRLIHAAAHPRNNSVDDPHQVLIIAKPDCRLFK